MINSNGPYAFHGLKWLTMSALVVALVAGVGCGEKKQPASDEAEEKEAAGEVAKDEKTDATGEKKAELSPDRFAEIFADLYKDNLLSLETRLDSDFEHAEDVVVEMAHLDPVSVRGAKELEERMTREGYDLDTAKKLLGQEGMGTRLTKKVGEVKRDHLGGLFAKLSEKSLPKMAEAKEGCAKLVKAIETAEAACVTPNTLARLHMGTLECKKIDLSFEAPQMPKPEGYRAKCLGSGALWPFLMKAAGK